MSKRIDLKHEIPIEGGGGQKVKIKYIELGRIKVKHLKCLPSKFEENGGKMEPQEMIPLIAGLSGRTEDEIGEIDLLDDLPKIAEELTNFLEESGVESPQTGSSEHGK